MGQHALLLTLLLGTSLHSKFLWVSCLLLTSVFLVGYFFQVAHWSVKERVLFLGWKSLLFGSLTAPKSHWYPEVRQEINGLIFRFRYSGHIIFKEPRESWCMRDLGLLLWCWLQWSKVLETAPKVNIEVVRLIQENHLIVSLLGMLQGLRAHLKSEAGPMTQSFAQKNIIKS